MTKMSQKEVLFELPATSLRTVWGLESSGWEILCNFPLKDLIEDNLEASIESGQLILSENGLRLSEEGLALADYITAHLLCNLEKKLDCQ